MSRKTAASSPAAPRLPGLLRFSGRAAAAGAPLGAEAIRLARSLGSAGARGRAGRRIAWAMLIALALWCLWVRADLAWNGPHMDELDYLYVGGLLLAGETWPTQTYVFSSDLPLWILALGERLGGGDFLGARAAVALLGLLSLGFLWRAAERAFRSWAVAGWATLLVAISPSHLFISRLATYDAVCFLFLAASL
ncbi:MAG: glycosyltransferase family 39 protein, partial [Acidobacteriota bacterium]